MSFYVVGKMSRGTMTFVGSIDRASRKAPFHWCAGVDDALHLDQASAEAIAQESRGRVILMASMPVGQLQSLLYVHEAARSVIDSGGLEHRRDPDTGDCKDWCPACRLVAASKAFQETL